MANIDSPEYATGYATGVWAANNHSVSIALCELTNEMECDWDIAIHELAHEFAAIIGYKGNVQAWIDGFTEGCRNES